MLGRADFTDLGAIHASIEVWTNLRQQFQQERAAESAERRESPVHDEWRAFDSFFSQMSSLDALSSRISKAVFNDPDNAKTCNADETDENIIEEEMALFSDKGNHEWVINPKQVIFNLVESTTNISVIAFLKNFRPCILYLRAYCNKKKS